MKAREEIWELINSVGCNFGLSVVSRPKQGRFLRNDKCLSPRLNFDIKTIGGGKYRLDSYVGIDAIEFEELWLKFCSKMDPILDIFDYSPLVTYYMNIPSVSISPSFSENLNDMEIKNNTQYLRDLILFSQTIPMELYKLISAINSGKMANIDTWKWSGHPVKMRAFFLWTSKQLKFSVTDSIFGIISENIYPYEWFDEKEWKNFIFY